MPQFISIAGTDHPVYPQKIHDHWREAADAKGFDLVARIDDRYHLALLCRTCGELSKKRLYSLMSHVPDCGHCNETAWRTTARAAGLQFLRRDSGDRHYAVYRASCGHEIRRQFEFVERIARGDVQHRCEVCQEAREQEEARARGWELVGPDPKGDANYRLYRHVEGCGGVTRIARVNMQTGRFTCPDCGEGWATARSFLYLMRFELGSGKTVSKLGFSRDPLSRMNFQLPRRPDLPRVLRYIVPMRSGAEALKVERQLHRQLKEDYPGAQLACAEFAADLKVRSEIYEGHMENVILRRLRRIARGQMPTPRRRPAAPRHETRSRPQAQAPRPGRRPSGSRPNHR